MPQPLGSKEASLFRHLVKDFESKQYKKGLKCADQILRKNPKHGDTQAMKALILNSLNQTDEAFVLAKEALKNDMKSHVCWHVYGILWRSEKNNEEAIKAYRFALRLEPDSPQVLRDLALLQIQTRDYNGYIQSRNIMLQQRSGLRLNWTAMAIAYHLAGDFKAAENVLSTYEGTLKNAPTKTDFEHSEAILYKNTIIAESGDIQRALEHLESIHRACLDKTAVMELRADYLLRLGRHQEAEKAYRALLDRNAEYRLYYEGLEKSLGLERFQKTELKKLYASIAAENDRVDAARRIPLDFLDGDDFQQAADSYLRDKLEKGVPSTFNNVKSLYVDRSKLKTIESLVEGYRADNQLNGTTNSNHAQQRHFQETVLYFLAQHYNYKLSRDLEKAMAFTEQLIEQFPTTYDYHMTKARILKHKGGLAEATKVMCHARELDVKDRYINTKCAKYQLRNEQNEEALETMSKFTRNEVVGGALGDLTDMQSLWYLTEDGEAHARKAEYGLALKRFHTCFDIFDVWQEDQFDFHSFSLRKGQIRAYIDALRWEDQLRNHPFYTRIALDAIQVYLKLNDYSNLKGESEVNGADSADVKATKQAKKEMERKEREEAEKRETERRMTAARKANATADGEMKKPDADPHGTKLLETKDPLAVATRFLTPLLDLNNDSLDAQHAGFEIYIRKAKCFLALKCLFASFKISPSNPTTHSHAIRLRNRSKLSGKDKVLLDSMMAALPVPYNDAQADLTSLNKSFLQAHPDSAGSLYGYIKAQIALDPTFIPQARHLILQLPQTCSAVTWQEGLEGIALLRDLKTDKDDLGSFTTQMQTLWPEASVLEREALR